MTYLFNNWVDFLFRLKNSRHIFLFLDYDGTLSPIASTPEEAHLPRRTKKLLKGLVKNPRFTLAVISGRSLKDIKRMVGLKGIIYAGNHGLEIAQVSGKIFDRTSILKKSPLKTICLALGADLKHIKGVRVEDKGCTLSVHFRLVKPGERVSVKKIFGRIVKPYVFSKTIKLSSGKMVLEVRPAIRWDKGKAVLHLLRKKKDALPLYIGDDVTDIDAFRAIKDRGISIFVGTPKKGICSDYFLKNPKEVERFLKKLGSYQRFTI